MAKILSEYLSEVAQKPFSYDGACCGAFVFGWADACTGRDGMRFWLGQYRTEDECNLAIDRWGGMRNWAFRFLADRYAIHPTIFRRVGNIALVQFGDLKTMAIRTSDIRFALRSNGVHLSSRAKVIEEWSVPCLL